MHGTRVTIIEENAVKEPPRSRLGSTHFPSTFPSSLGKVHCSRKVWTMAFVIGGSCRLDKQDNNAAISELATPSWQKVCIQSASWCFVGLYLIRIALSAKMPRGSWLNPTSVSKALNWVAPIPCSTSRAMLSMIRKTYSSVASRKSRSS